MKPDRFPFLHSIRFRACRGAVLGGLLALLFAGCGGGEEVLETTPDGLTRIVLQTDWYPQAEHGGFYQALAKGYYREAGLEVEIRSGGPNAMTLEKVVLGVAHFALGRSDQILLEASRGLPLQIVGADLQRDPQGIMVHAASDVRDLADLDGRAVMAVPGMSFIEIIKRTYGIDFRVLPSDFGMDRFLADPDFIQQCFVTSEPYYVRQAGAEPRVLMISESGFEPYHVWYTRSDFAGRHPALVQAFSEASIRGWREYMTGDRAAANALIAARNAKMTPAFLDFSHAQMLAYELVSGPGGDWSAVGRVTPARLQRQIEQLEEIGVLTEPVTVAEVFDPALLPESAP